MHCCANIYLQIIDGIATANYCVERLGTTLARIATHTCCADLLPDDNDYNIINAHLLDTTYKMRNVTNVVINYYKYDNQLSTSSLIEWLIPRDGETILRIVTLTESGRYAIRFISLLDDGKDLIHNTSLLSDTDLSNIEASMLEQLQDHEWISLV